MRKETTLYIFWISVPECCTLYFQAYSTCSSCILQVDVIFLLSSCYICMLVRNSECHSHFLVGGVITTLRKPLHVMICGRYCLSLWHWICEVECLNCLHRSLYFSHVYLGVMTARKRQRLYFRIVLFLILFYLHCMKLTIMLILYVHSVLCIVKLRCIVYVYSY